MWGVVTTPSAVAGPANTVAAQVILIFCLFPNARLLTFVFPQVTWYLGPSSTSPFNTPLASFGNPCTGACAGTLVNTASGAPQGAWAPLRSSRRACVCVLMRAPSSATGYVPVGLSATHAFTGLGGNVPASPPTCLKYIHPLKNGAVGYTSPLICTAVFTGLVPNSAYSFTISSSVSISGAPATVYSTSGDVIRGGAFAFRSAGLPSGGATSPYPVSWVVMAGAPPPAAARRLLVCRGERLTLPSPSQTWAKLITRA